MTIRAAYDFSVMYHGAAKAGYVRGSGTKLKTAPIRRSVVATSGLDNVFLTWVSTARRATLPILSADCEDEDPLSGRVGVGTRWDTTFSTSAPERLLTGSAEKKARWAALINGMMRCLERMSADIVGPTLNVSQRHRNVSFLSSNARS